MYTSFNTFVERTRFRGDQRDLTNLRVDIEQTDSGNDSRRMTIIP